ncbi:MAG: pilus assembly FimT family protein, partial [Rhodanobacteraceae bacterium]
MQIARKNLGFTLIELLMTLAVVAILLAVAMPASGGLTQATKAQTARSELGAALGTARLAAVSRTKNVVVCPSRDQQYCGRTTEWQHGWVVFLDSD